MEIILEPAEIVRPVRREGIEFFASTLTARVGTRGVVDGLTE
jgi:hypothetical protein